MGDESSFYYLIVESYITGEENLIKRKKKKGINTFAASIKWK